MKNIMLVCNVGMFIGMFVKKIEVVFGNILNVIVYSEFEYIDYLDGVDFVFIGF